MDALQQSDHQGDPLDGAAGVPAGRGVTVTGLTELCQEIEHFASWATQASQTRADSRDEQPAAEGAVESAQQQSDPPHPATGRYGGHTWFSL